MCHPLAGANCVVSRGQYVMPWLGGVPYDMKSGLTRSGANPGFFRRGVSGMGES